MQSDILITNMESISRLGEGGRLEIEDNALQYKEEKGAGAGGIDDQIIAYIRENPQAIDFSNQGASGGLEILGRAMETYHRQHEREEIPLQLPRGDEKEWEDKIKHIPLHARLAVTQLIIEGFEGDEEQQRDLLSFFPNLRKINDQGINVEDPSLRAKLTTHQFDREAIEEFHRDRNESLIDPKRRLYLEVVEDEYGKHLRAVPKSNWLEKLLMKWGWSSASMSKVLAYLDRKYEEKGHREFLKIDEEEKRSLEGVIDRYQDRHAHWYNNIKRIAENIIGALNNSNDLKASSSVEKADIFQDSKKLGAQEFFDKWIRPKLGEGELDSNNRGVGSPIWMANTYVLGFLKGKDRSTAYGEAKAWPLELRELVTEKLIVPGDHTDYLDYFPNIDKKEGEPFKFSEHR